MKRNKRLRIEKALNENKIKFKCHTDVLHGVKKTSYEIQYISLLTPDVVSRFPRGFSIEAFSSIITIAYYENTEERENRS